MASLLSSVWLGGCSVVGYRGGVEEPAYEVIDHVDGVALRRYAERLAADTVVSADDASAARSAGFKILADYIFGNNRTQAKLAMAAPVAQSSEKIAMTAPVSQTQTDKGWRVRFFLPGDLTRTTAPVPNSDRVELVTVAPEIYAVLRFSGSRDTPAVASHTSQLRATLESSGWQIAAPPVAWFYDPPWTLPFARRNEVAVQVNRKTD